MGFDNECILNIQNLPGEYFCPICRTLVYPDEALQSQCTHLYCKPCLAYVVGTTRACPYDGYLVTEADSKPLIESNKSIAEAIGKVPVYCLYHRSGCQWQGTLTECTAHCPECSYGNCPVICNRCGMHIIHRQVQEHAHSCPTLQSQPQQLDSALTQVSTGQSEIINEALSTASTSTAMAAPSSTSTAMPVASSTPSAQTVASMAITSAAAASDSTPAAASDQATQTQAAAIAQPQVPPAEQWYQQQQMQYQQYYQQYPGYDPYQQQYQHYGQYQQQVHQQYPQTYLQVPVQPVVQGQQQPLHTMQPQPLSQPHSQLSMQNQQPALQIQPQGQAAQPQVQAQPPPQALTAQPQPQQQHYPQLPQHPQQPQLHSHQLHVPAQQLLTPTQPQNHPPPYAQMARQSQPQPQPQPHPHAQPPQFPTQPNPQLSKSLPPQSHLHSQMPQQQPPRQQPHMQQQPHSQPHLRPQSQPIPQAQPQQPAAQAVTGHQSYPQPYPFQPAPSGVAQQRPMHMHPQHLQAPIQPVQHTGHMHNQFPPQQNQMRPPPNSVPGQAQQIGMLPPQSSRGSAIPSLQPGQQFHHHAGMQPQQFLPHNQAQSQLHPTQQYQQGPYLPQQAIRSQAPTLQQSVPAPPVAHGVTSYQAQVPAPGPGIISHGTPQPASQQISTQYPLESNLTESSEVKSGTMQHAQVTPSQGPLLPQPSTLQSGASVDHNQASTAKESSRLIASELKGKSSPEKGAQVHKLEVEMEPKNSKGADLAQTKTSSDYVAISVDEGKANADSRESSQPNSDGKDVQESAHVRSSQSDNLDVQVAEHATDKVSHFTNDAKEVLELSAAQGDMLSNGAGRVQSLQDSRESLSSSQSKERAPIADVPQGIPPAGSFPGEKYDHQTYGISPNMSEQTMNSQRASAPDRMVPQHMQLHDPPFAPSQMRPPVHNVIENRSSQGQGRQPYGSYLNEVPKAGHLGSFSNYSSSTGALGQNPLPLPANGPPAGVFAAAGGMTSNLPPGLESQTGQPRHTNGDHSKGHAGGTERFGSRPFSEERFQSTVHDPYRRATSQGDLEEDFKRFPKSTHSESESLPKFDGPISSSWSAEGSRPLVNAFPPNSSGSTLLPMREHHKPGGIHDEWGRRSDALGAIPGAGNHLVGGLAPLRSPGREYTGFEMRKFGFSKQGTDHFGKEPLNFGERSHAFNMPSDSFNGSFLESRFPRPYAPGPTSFPGGSSDGLQHMRMMDQLASRNLPGDSGNELDGPAMHPSHFRHLRSNEAFGRSHLHFSDPGGFGGLHRDTRMGERSFAGHFPPHARESTGYLPVHMRSGESGPTHGYSMHGFPNETGRFGLVSNFDEIDSFGHSSKRNLASIGWCRLCKIDCGSVEGLDIHSQTREHQKMAMDIVLNIKQENSKKKKKAIDDGTAIEGPSKSRKVKF
ncbi:uncharacterized protein LOC120273468 [Dioscorea cayenensis subsp. rotundata]|uniref:Uncharacterized protein LOC120273468 n=1 Tax=Dioscorea cayennensis subsp. rotundata TaxID=55577 RepID=A0AB40C858_DIOCR|nr:uncharacterized protein LOC120273468 [Dioscorea cayenensis subsp. rotundata]